MGLVFSRRGDLESWAPLDRALPDALATTQPQYIVAVRLARAEAFWLAERNDEAQQEIEATLVCAEHRDPWQCGDVQTWLQRTGSDRRLRQEVAAPHALTAEGRHREAAQMWVELGSSYRAGLSLLDVGDEESVRDALARFDALGARAAARVARLRLRELGARSIPSGPRRATREDPLGLTPREREVLELLCARRTNAQIAQELFISPKTVDHHVSAVLAKLGASNRDVAAETARELGLVCAN
jgi:DNA-binding CsgD family transcriptional regulator